MAAARLPGRVTVALVSPFDGRGELVPERAGELAHRLLEAGADGFLIGGSTAESPTLSDEELERLVAAVREAIGGRAPVYVGTGTYDTRASIRRSRKAEGWGADGILLVTPYYNKPPQEGLYRHFRSVAEAVSLPVMLYNVPGRTAVNLAPETVVRLVRDVPNIVALKQASGNFDETSEIVRRTEGRLAVYSGDDSLTLPMLAVGGVGVISVSGHLVPGRLAAMIDAFRRGDVEEARRIHLELLPLHRALFVTTNPIPVKWALERTGFPVGECRPPLAPLSEGGQAVVEAALRETGLIA
ncbi:MAG: 4-hydroxy-tetrahydrodipicolinate synthase [Bacillota bacterium]|nr:4-hydroxy-tetrahydrodipicolinate synthase [Bacillota bacterium]